MQSSQPLHSQRRNSWSLGRSGKVECRASAQSAPRVSRGASLPSAGAHRRSSSGVADDVASRRQTTYWEGIGDTLHFVMLVEPHSAAINWRGNPPMSKKKPNTDRVCEAFRGISSEMYRGVHTEDLTTLLVAERGSPLPPCGLNSAHGPVPTSKLR